MVKWRREREKEKVKDSPFGEGSSHSTILLVKAETKGATLLAYLSGDQMSRVSFWGFVAMAGNFEVIWLDEELVSCCVDHL